LIRDKCNVNNFPIDSHKDFKKVWRHAYLEGKNSPIEDHKDYLSLMNKYAIRGKGKCGFLPCKEIQRHPEYDTEKERLRKEWENEDISKHPGYRSLMERYAIKGKTTRDSKTCGYHTGYIPCKDITKHPSYETEKRKWLREWNKIPIYRHPQYRSSIERLLKNLLEKLGQDAKCTISGGELDALVDMYGGSPDIIEQFKCAGMDPGINQLYSQVVNNRSKPCPPPPIQDHPSYEKLVASITEKVRKEFGCRDSGCVGVKRCSEYVPILKSQEKKRCDDRVTCLRKNCDRQKKDIEDHWKRLYKKFMEKCKDDKDELNEEIKKVKTQLDCCKRQYNKCKNMPVHKHPDFEGELRKEQMKLLEMIRQEQQKCKTANAYKLNSGAEPFTNQTGGKKKNFAMN
jgi:hypothetical protein